MVIKTAGLIALWRFSFTGGTVIQKQKPFILYYGHDYVSSVALHGVFREPGCNECAHYTSVTVLACAGHEVALQTSSNSSFKGSADPRFFIKALQCGSSLIVKRLRVAQSTWLNWSQHSVVTKTAGHIALSGV